MAVLEANEEVRELSMVLNHSQRRPQEIKIAQWRAWGSVKWYRLRWERASRQLEAAMLGAKKSMAQTEQWEKQHQQVIEQFLRLCEKVKRQASEKEMAQVRKIRKKLGDKFQDEVTREPILRRMMSASRSRPPTPI